ncbi:MAG: NAD-dependent epimerase/dehydratase family protein [Nitrospirales bacterium]|nr:NAD-dependent epimerase/dehydratase family protein [Nitrospira sp.]MDR4503148.1 NAD-dependent epimerase/dehydratase family protein [Nitrospirales bacterium]
MSRIVALTGGTGFIGQVLWRFLEEAGWTVRVLVRSSFRPKRQESSSTTEFVQGTLHDEKPLHDLIKDAEAIVHCAGRVRGLHSHQFEQTNVEGVRRIVRLAASQQTPPRFVLISSLAAREPSLSNYAWSKNQGELALEEAAGFMPWIIFRPPAVYGPQDHAILPLFRWIRRGIGVQLGSDRARFSMLFVEDLANAVLAWLDRGVHAGRAFELHDGKTGGYSWQEVFELVSEKKVWRLVVPASLLNATASMNQVMARIIGYDPILTYGKVRELRHADWVCDNSALRLELGWRPSVMLKEGVRRSLSGL